ncbi:signal recognition particle-docking protein FtsY [Merdimmobilis hominis]|uniref:Signal recognition particle receptor FtsY n=1 Tax=uncultured Anaerotruncus sp. TaxID=905011 RepID=A0A6N2RLF3_9FIRM|nr:signal recognition particle-docking protein FtsY [Merdimmobilis hominis]
MGFFSKISEGLKKTRDSFAKKVEAITNSFTTIDDDLMDELEETLILSDVGVTTSQHIVEALRRRIKERGVTDAREVKGLLKEIIAEMLEGGQELNLSTKPAVILVIGVNGVGKTTTIGKLAHQLKEEGKTVLLAAADTFRAAAIDQLEIWADRAGVDLIKHQEGSDPAAVVFDAVNAGRARGVDVIICDTAGRLHNKKNLMDELAKISRVIARELPDSAVETLLVLDGTTGQNALNQAKLFGEAAGLTGIVLTKLDGTARGGVVIGIKEELKIPVKYIGVGEGIDDLRPFDPVDFADALFGEESSKEIPQEEAPIPQEEE